MIPVILESPYAGNFAENIHYARLAMRDSLLRGEAPMASHLLYTQCLDDTSPEERQLGIDAGLTWRHFAEKSVVYTDLGISSGMKYGMDLMQKTAPHPVTGKKRIVEMRSIDFKNLSLPESDGMLMAHMKPRLIDSIIQEILAEYGSVTSNEDGFSIPGSSIYFMQDEDNTSIQLWRGEHFHDSVSSFEELVAAVNDVKLAS